MKSTITYPLSQLSEREVEVSLLLVKGYTTQRIAKSLYLSFETIKTHRSNLMTKLGAKNALHLGVLLQQIMSEY